jgi:hypothetical protein
MSATDFLIDVAARGRKPQRLVIVRYGQCEHRDRIDTDSATSRGRFVAALAAKANLAEADQAELDRLIVAAADEADELAETAAADVSDDGDRRESQSSRLIKLATEMEFWHTPDGEAWASIPIHGHRQHWRVGSKTFRNFLAGLYYRGSGAAANAQAIQDALAALSAKALHEGESHPVFVRIAEHEGKHYVDLGDDQWRAAEIDANGWRVIDNPPVRFRRSKGTLPQPKPEHGGQIELLRRFIAVDDDCWALILGWLVAALWPRGPYPLLCFSSEQGSGKSTRARMLRALVDPAAAPLRCEPGNSRDLAIAAANGWVIALDNLSGLPVWLSDALCRLSTGGGFATRTLYENDEESIFDAQRPVIVTGIDDPIARGDLLDRTLIVSLPSILANQRQTETTLWAEFTPLVPKLLGCLLTAVSVAMKRLPTIHLSESPRMADFAALITAAEPALGLTDGEFLRAYNRNRDDANSLALESSPVAKFLLELLAEGNWAGTATELLGELRSVAGIGDDARRIPKGWPTNAKGMSGTLKRLAPNLRREGIEVTFERSGRGRRICLSRNCGDANDDGDARKTPFSAERNGTVPAGVVLWEDSAEPGIYPSDSNK